MGNQVNYNYILLKREVVKRFLLPPYNYLIEDCCPLIFLLEKDIVREALSIDIHLADNSFYAP
jgi:hypothetical protein